LKPMDIEELKSNWKQTKISIKDRKELASMNHIQKHPQLTSIRFKLVIEVVFLFTFLATYNNIFDGADKPLWVHITLLAAALFYLITDVFGYLTLRAPLQGENLKESLHQFYLKLNRIRIFSLISSLMFGLAVLVFFATTFTEYGVLKFSVLFVSLLFMIYVLHRNWARRTRQIKTASMEFEEYSDDS